MTSAELIGFDNEKYLKEQTSAILERVNRFNDKLYIEFGGKILYDYHAKGGRKGRGPYGCFACPGCCPAEEAECKPDL